MRPQLARRLLRAHARVPSLLQDIKSPFPVLGPLVPARAVGYSQPALFAMKYTIAAAATRMAIRKANFTNFHARMTSRTTTIAATMACHPARTGMSDPLLLGVLGADGDTLAVD